MRNLSGIKKEFEKQPSQHDSAQYKTLFNATFGSDSSYLDTSQKLMVTETVTSTHLSQQLLMEVNIYCSGIINIYFKSHY